MVTTQCSRCGKTITVRLLMPEDLGPDVRCDACWQAQECDFSQKLPVAVHVVWEVA